MVMTMTLTMIAIVVTNTPNVDQVSLTAVGLDNAPVFTRTRGQHSRLVVFLFFCCFFLFVCLFVCCWVFRVCVCLFFFKFIFLFIFFYFLLFISFVCSCHFKPVLKTN